MTWTIVVMDTVAAINHWHVPVLLPSDRRHLIITCPDGFSRFDHLSNYQIRYIKCNGLIADLSIMRKPAWNQAKREQVKSAATGADENLVQTTDKCVELLFIISPQSIDDVASSGQTLIVNMLI
jgi:hypothetical protein